MIKKLYYTVLVIFITFEVFMAQGGSSYSRNGIGDLFHSSSARRLGMGELGSAIIDKDYVDGFNPASWTSLRYTRFSLSARYSGANYSDINSSSFHTNVMFSGFTIGFPVERELGISIALGLIPIAATRYDVVNDVTHPDLGSYKNSFNGSGSLSKMFLGTSIKVPTNTSLGATFEYYTGTNNYYSDQVFDENSEFDDISYKTQYKYRGVGATFSVISGNLLNLLQDSTDSQLRLSAVTNIKSGLTTDTLIVANTSIGELERLTGETETNLPVKLTFGASYAWDKKYMILFDYHFQPYSKYKFNGKTDFNLKDLKKYSLGFEYKNKDLGMHPTALEQMSYRLGVSYEETQYTFNGINIDQYSVHGGLSVPFGDINMIDLGMSVGLRGTTDNNLIKEQFINASVTLTLGELWFVRENR